MNHLMCDAGMEQKWHVMGGEGLHTTRNTTQTTPLQTIVPTTIAGYAIVIEIIIHYVHCSTSWIIW